jgi:hypothetical protein
MMAARKYSELAVGWILCTTARVMLSKCCQVSGEIDEGSRRAGARLRSGEHLSLSTIGVEPNAHSKTIMMKPQAECRVGS